MMPATRAGNPNIITFEAMVQALGELSDALVFVGGCSTGLLVTSVQAQPIRVTEDVDVVVQAASAREYHAMESGLRKRGFTHDPSEDAPICRWRYGSLQLDLMPAAPGILGFHNRWYTYAVESAQMVTLPSGASIKLITAPAFVATKLEAFKGRAPATIWSVTIWRTSSLSSTAAYRCLRRFAPLLTICDGIWPRKSRRWSGARIFLMPCPVICRPMRRARQNCPV